MNKTPLTDVELRCSTCGSKSTAAEVNADIERYYCNQSLSFIKFPELGIGEKNMDQLKKLTFLCELCHEKERS
jgi:hypothetical protein